MVLPTLLTRLYSVVCAELQKFHLNIMRHLFCDWSTDFFIVGEQLFVSRIVLYNQFVHVVENSYGHADFVEIKSKLT